MNPPKEAAHPPTTENAPEKADATKIAASGPTVNQQPGCGEGAPTKGPESVPASNELKNAPGTGPKASSVETDEQAFKRLAALSKVDYDRVREKEAERLTIRLPTLDDEVERRRPRSQSANSKGAQARAEEPWGEAVDSTTLLDGIRTIISRFMSLPPFADVILTLWVLHTYVFDCFRYTPYLYVRSPLPGCGKSILAEIMSVLCYLATTPGSMSSAAMFRRIDARRPTLLLDEWDTLPEQTRLAALNILNTGFKWNGVYTICVGDDHQDTDFQTFCPKAIFGLSEAKLPEATRTRCLTITLQKMKRGEKIQKLPRAFDPSEIRRKCLRWANDWKNQLQSSNPTMPNGLGPRQEDICEPLLAIADACGEHWPETVRSSLVQFFKVRIEDDESHGRQLLKDICNYFHGDESDRTSSRELCNHLNNCDSRPWGEFNRGQGITQRKLSEMLRPFGIMTRDLRFGESTVNKGFNRSDFDDAFLRYLSLVREPNSNRYNATTPANIDDSADSQSATEPPCSGCENAVSNSNDGPCSVVADEKSVEAEREPTAKEQPANSTAPNGHKPQEDR